MNWDQVAGNWKQFTGRVQEKWGDLSNDDLEAIDGNREQLEGKIQELYGKSKEEAKEEVNALLQEWKSSDDQS